MEVTTERDPSLRAVLVLLGTALPIYVADQVTKAAVVASLELGQRVELLGDVVMLWHARNTGGAFSILQGQLWLFVPVTIVALGMVAYFHRTLRDRSPWIQVVLGMILGGALGNFTDRIRLGYVVDFVSVGIGDLRWPTFNVADPAVVGGIILLVGYLTFVDRQPRDR